MFHCVLMGWLSGAQPFKSSHSRSFSDSTYMGVSESKTSAVAITRPNANKTLLSTLFYAGDTH